MKNCIITGASSGIGEATARLLHRHGCHVSLIARKEDKLQAIAKELGDGCDIYIGDVRDYQGIAQIISDIATKRVHIDVLINNAGLGFFDAFAGGKIEEWHEMIDVNVKGLLNCIHAALPHLITSTGQLINIGSVASHLVFPNSGVYCATKHAVFAISESIRMELPDKVRVTTISPGSVNTPFVDRTTNETMLKEYKNYFAAGMSAELIAEQIWHAVNCPPGSVVSEIIIRPSRAVK